MYAIAWIEGVNGKGWGMDNTCCTVVRWDGLEISTSIYYCSTLDKNIVSADSVVRTNYSVGRGSREYREFGAMLLVRTAYFLIVCYITIVRPQAKALYGHSVLMTLVPAAFQV